MMSDNKQQKPMIIDDVAHTVDRVDDKKQAQQLNADKDVARRHAEMKTIDNLKKLNEDTAAPINVKYYDNNFNNNNKYPN